MSFISRSRQKGFTIAELLIVIVIIGILASLIVALYNGVQLRARDAQRADDANTVQKFLETYLVTNGSYIKSDRFLNANAAAALASGPLVGLPKEALRGPTASAATVSSWGQWAGDVITNGYDYSVKSFTSTNGDCLNSNGNVDSDCTRFEIYYKVENGNTYKKLDSVK